MSKSARVSCRNNEEVRGGHSKPVEKPFWGLFKGRKHWFSSSLSCCLNMPPVSASRGGAMCTQALLAHPTVPPSYMCAPLMQNMLRGWLLSVLLLSFQGWRFHGYGGIMGQLCNHLWQIVLCVKSIILFLCTWTYLRPIFCPRSPCPVEW